LISRFNAKIIVPGRLAQPENIAFTPPTIATIGNHDNMLTPEQFAVNEAWVVFTLDAPVLVEDGSYNIF
jgi:hypothetical protein